MRDVLNRVWDAVCRVFSDCDADLIIAANMLENFPRDRYTFDSAMLGFGFRCETGRWSHDAVSYLVASGKFAHLGLTSVVKWNRLIPMYRNYTMTEAVRRAFRLSMKEFNYLFSPSQYDKGFTLTQERVAERVKQFATDRRIQS